MKLCGTISFLLLMTVPASTQERKPAPADVLFVNARIHDSAPPEVQPSGDANIRRKLHSALAVSNGRVRWIGSSGDAKTFRGPQTQVIDLAGKDVYPGFNDAHLHLASGGFEKLNVNLIGAKSLQEMTERVADRAKQTNEGEWITGRGWDHTKWSEVKLPSRHDLDAVTGNKPAFLVRVDGHIAVANSAALKAAGVTQDTFVPAGGSIDKDEQGELTGIIRETAMGLITAKIPRPSQGRRRRAIELALRDAAQWGITSAQDNSDWEDFLIYEELERAGKLTLRITEWLPFDAPLELLQSRRAHRKQPDVMLRTGMLKGFMDGSLGSRTAALLAPYSDDPKNSGLPRYTQSQLDQMAIERTRAGFQIGLHAIGDRGVEMALNAFEAARRDCEQRKGSATARNCHDLRFRIEHAQVVDPKHFARFKQLGVIASMQPNHLLTDMNWAESRIGVERAKTSYPWKQFEESGVKLAFGTDYPVEPITPFRGLYAAVTRKNEEGSATYHPEQKLDIHDAIAAYTQGAAYAEYSEGEKGTLEAGMLADFVVLDRDITSVPHEEILKTRVLRTLVGGKTVYEAGRADSSLRSE